MNRLLFIIFITLCSVLSVSAEDSFVVVLDPGHGGKDYGAMGKLTNEKTINLEVALRLRALLEKYEGVKVVMTRSTDVFLSLQERADVANKANGDLFVSIHVNSVDKRNKNRASVKGASVYTLGLHRSQANFEVAKRENSVIELEPDFSTVYQGFDPNSAESYIIFELTQNRHLTQSINFAQLAEHELTTTGGRADRGVLQAGFWVLLASAMPAALVELDFICNPTQEQFLHSSAGTEKMARSLANAIAAYGSLKPKSDQSDQSDTSDVSDKSDESNDTEAPAVNHALTYRVQFMACDRELPAGSPQFKGLTEVSHYVQGGLHKYTVGDCPSEREAEKLMRTVQKKFPQAFIIKWQDGQRVN